MKQEISLQTKDLQSAGISSQLTSNDLLEVIAHDINEKFMEEIKSCQNEARKIMDKMRYVLAPECEQMKAVLVKGKMLGAKEETSFGYSKVDGNEWRSGITLMDIQTTEKTGGLKIDTNSRGGYFTYPNQSESKVLLKVTTDERDNETKKVLGDISCEINTIISKKFEKVIVVKGDRFKAIVAEIKEHNKRVDGLMNILPENKIISVERFAREARVKMNKKILSSQPEEFKKKISALFNIKL